ncbi:hypothetical protein [Saccharothrix luteola]|uniref:hypothetical protein n=1 Tax=Saccharothrix luteola TaxID=2893018 RepID=UPI001E45DD15|nr:hypothetical protein [Saccharothrix luteola]MCC8250141.1 hypothetical protein [Saccharothrix luteola]
MARNCGDCTESGQMSTPRVGGGVTPSSAASASNDATIASDIGPGDTRPNVCAIVVTPAPAPAGAAPSVARSWTGRSGRRARSNGVRSRNHPRGSTSPMTWPMPRSVGSTPANASAMPIPAGTARNPASRNAGRNGSPAANPTSCPASRAARAGGIEG